MSDDRYTAGASRALGRAGERARAAGTGSILPLDLLAALAEEEEGRAAALILRHGLPPEGLIRLIDCGWDDRPPADSLKAEEPSFSDDARAILNDATRRARALDRNRQVSSEDILAALIDAPSPFGPRLAEAGLDVASVLREVTREETETSAPLPLADDIAPLELVSPSEVIDLGRVLDASSNRAREGLRVVEDYVRFVLDDPALTRRLKDVRHRFDQCVRGFDPDLLIASRDTTGDVGTRIMTAGEVVRENPRAVLAANFKRVAEALRSLEEYAKLVDVWISGRFEVLRYDVYTLEKLTLSALSAAKTFEDVRLYVLVGGSPTLNHLTWIVGEALAGGAQAIQLREKGLPDREWLARAREVRILTSRARARFLVNDRPDLARLAGADGVHLGQEDMTVRDARRVVGPGAAIGVSTHERGQMEKAILDGASYLGVGPVFASGTKDFDDLTGLGYVRLAAETTKLPWFAIGGIDDATIHEAIEAGARRVAVSGAILNADRPRDAARALRKALDSAS